VVLISSHYFSRLYFYATPTRRAGKAWERSNKVKRSPNPPLKKRRASPRPDLHFHIFIYSFVSLFQV